jgi:chemotaxis protein histidine kinase CheA
MFRMNSRDVHRLQDLGRQLLSVCERMDQLCRVANNVLQSIEEPEPRADSPGPVGADRVAESGPSHIPPIAEDDSLEASALSALGGILRDVRVVGGGLQGLCKAIESARFRRLGVLFDAFRETIRTLAESSGKRIEVDTAGGDLRIERTILEKLRTPLLQMVRNAVDHGIETTTQRVNAGKIAVGRITLRAVRKKRALVLSVTDDGAGIRADVVRRAAVQRGVLTAEAADQLDDEGVIPYIFQAGLTTVQQATEISGRGMGLDIAARVVRGLGGELAVSSRPGLGTTFRVTIPGARFRAGVHDAKGA